MAAIITEKFRMSNAEVFKTDFGGSNKYYMFIGKSSPWTTQDAAGASDSAPPTPADDVTSELWYWDDMIAAKNIASTDVSFVAPRRNWANGTTYDMYEHDISSSNTTTSSAANIYNSTFYFLTADYRIYKVLDNNGGAAYNGTEPTLEQAAPFSQGGYLLQYMNTVGAGEADKFLTTDFMPVSTNSDISTAATDGAIDSLRIVNQGSGLTNGTYYAKVYGDGSNAGTASGAIIEIKVASQQIQSFGLTSGTNTIVKVAGSGYTYANILLTAGNTFSDQACSSAANIGGSGADIEAIISPKGGHGYDAPKELGAHYIMLNTTFSNTDAADVTSANDFRRVGIVKNPYTYGTTTIGSAGTYRTTKAMYMSGGSGFVADEKITQASTGAIGRVVEWDNTNKILYYVQERFGDYGTIAATQNFVAFSGTNAVSSTGGSGTPTAGNNTVDSILFTAGYANSELDADSGDIIYIENRKPITRATDQVEDIKIIVEF